MVLSGQVEREGVPDKSSQAKSLPCRVEVLVETWTAQEIAARLQVEA